MDVKIEEGWKRALAHVWQSDQFARLADTVRQSYRTAQVFPPAGKIFEAMNLCPFDLVKAVIIGQDPYHDDGQANGLCFSVNPGVRIPPSLINIFKEQATDLGKPMPASGDLSHWARQGVLLLNSSLTVLAHRPASHSAIGWDVVTSEAIRQLSQQREHLVFLLWGSHAIAKSSLIDKTRHLVLTAPHPSPLSAHRGFFGCRHFSKTNEYLISHNIDPIQW